MYSNENKLIRIDIFYLIKLNFVLVTLAIFQNVILSKYILISDIRQLNVSRQLLESQ